MRSNHPGRKTVWTEERRPVSSDHQLRWAPEGCRRPPTFGRREPRRPLIPANLPSNWRLRSSCTGVSPQEPQRSSGRTVPGRSEVWPGVEPGRRVDCLWLYKAAAHSARLPGVFWIGFWKNRIVRSMLSAAQARGRSTACFSRLGSSKAAEKARGRDSGDFGGGSPKRHRSAP